MTLVGKVLRLGGYKKTGVGYTLYVKVEKTA